MSERRRRDDPDTDEHYHERYEESDLVARVGKTIERYKIFWIVIMAALGWWGRTVMEPLRVSAQTTAEVRLINQKLDSVIVPRLDAADRDRAQMIRIQETQTSQIGVLSRLQCLHTSYIDRVKISLLDCKDIPVETPPTRSGPF
jgi:hypothetical protein